MQLHSILISKENVLNYLAHPYGLPYRIFWDYDHEKMVNGAYLGDLGIWDKFIPNETTSIEAATNASAFHNNSLRNDYISAAASYFHGKPFKASDTATYNPLRNEPLFLVLERDLLLPKVVVSDTAIDYGNVTDVTPLAHDVTLTNQGIGDLQLNKTNYALTGRDAALFKVTPACPTIMATAQTCGFTVTFTPPAKPWLTGYFGIKTATLTIKSNDRDNPALKITLKARLKDTGVALAIGKTYQGGIIFYLDGTSQHGLIAAPNDQGTGLEWGFYSTTGATGIAIGTGKANTTSIVAKLGDGWAAALCDNLVLNGYSDWFLPSRNELALLYANKEVIGGFASSIYWSSSEDDFTDAWAQNFVSGIQSFGNKHNEFRVRAVRAF